MTGISLVPRKDHPDNDKEVLNFSELNRYIKVQECKLPSVNDLHVGMASTTRLIRSHQKLFCWLRFFIKFCHFWS